MKRHYFAIAAAALTIASTGAAMALEYPDGVIVVSDGWCGMSGDCNNCNGNRLIKKTRCDGSYCDNMVHQCSAPPIVNGVQTVMDGQRFIANSGSAAMRNGWTSDEQGIYSPNAICPVGYAMVGQYAQGNYADDIRTSCQKVKRPGAGGVDNWNGITITLVRAATPISEERRTPPTHEITTGYWLSGASCTGSYCDNLYYIFNTISW